MPQTLIRDCMRHSRWKQGSEQYVNLVYVYADKQRSMYGMRIVGKIFVEVLIPVYQYIAQSIATDSFFVHWEKLAFVCNL